ncbi:hypothetical protein D3C85_1263040 [compost metagenome]
MPRQAQFHLILVPTEQPFVARRIAFVQCDLVLRQIGRVLRCAVFLDIGWGRAEQAVHAEQLALDQRLGHRREHLEGHVEALLDRVDHAIVDDHIDLDVRVQQGELGQ